MTPETPGTPEPGQASLSDYPRERGRPGAVRMVEEAGQAASDFRSWSEMTDDERQVPHPEVFALWYRIASRGAPDDAVIRGWDSAPPRARKFWSELQAAVAAEQPQPAPEPPSEGRWCIAVNATGQPASEEVFPTEDAAASACAELNAKAGRDWFSARQVPTASAAPADRDRHAGMNESLRGEIAAARRLAESYRSRLAELAAGIDPGKLDLLADWFDQDDAAKGKSGTDVQADLRRWARAVRSLREHAGLDPQ